MRTLEHYLETFKQHATPNLDILLYQYDGGQSSYTIHISGIIHGNEVGSLPTLITLIEELEHGTILFGGKIHITLGNPEASRANRRFVDADLNRLFLKSQPLEHIDTHEGQRARVLMPWLDECDCILDLHQTMLPSATPFYIFPRTDLSIALAEAIGGSKSYIDATPSDEKPTYQCADEYVWRQGKPALTLELGEMGFHAPAEKASAEAVHNLIATMEMLRNRKVLDNPQTMLQTLQELSTGPLSHYHTVHRQPYLNPSWILRPGLINFQTVQTGEYLNAKDTPELTAPCNGRLLFPKYPRRDEKGHVIETLPKELYRIIQEA
jgi:succinylglutamate desuccinylase